MKKHEAMLLECCKKALSFISSLDLEEREAEILQLEEYLRDAILKVDPSMRAKTHFTLTMTPATYDSIIRMVNTYVSKGSEEAEEIRATIKRGTRITKQRVYITLSYNKRLLTAFYKMFEFSAPPPWQARSFDRIAVELRRASQVDAFSEIIKVLV